MTCECGQRDCKRNEGQPTAEQLNIVGSWLNDQERRTGWCRCGQELWSMPMDDCPMKFHHDPAFIPSNPESPFYPRWLRSGKDAFPNPNKGE